MCGSRTEGPEGDHSLSGPSCVSTHPGAVLAPSRGRSVRCRRSRQDVGPVGPLGAEQALGTAPLRREKSREGRAPQGQDKPEILDTVTGG